MGTQFKTWFLHVTVVPWFRLPDASGNIAHGLEKALTGVVPFEAIASGEAHFGPRKRPVRLLQTPTPFTEVEQRVRSYLHKKRAWLVDETTKRRYEFRPHVTVQGTDEFGENGTFRCDRLYIIEQKGDYKEVVSEIYLK